MSSTELKISKDTSASHFLADVDDNAVYKYRLKTYIDWLKVNNLSWINADLRTYRDYLRESYSGRDKEPLAANTVKAHLSTIRGRYKRILKSNALRDMLYASTPENESPSDRKAFVDETIERLKNAIDPEYTTIKVVKRQDTPDNMHIRLSEEQSLALINKPSTNTLRGLRDTAIISLLLCTGIREAELCALNIEDLKRSFGGDVALHIRHGKGSKERLIPYGSLNWVLTIVGKWLENAGIEEGAVFRGFYKGCKRVRRTRLTVRAINQILERYPIEIKGTLRKINPHNLRRTYARQLYEAGVDLLAIRDNLGHADSRTTLGYIGTMDVDARKPPPIYSFDIQTLNQED